MRPSACRFSIEASRNALEANAPEEVLRVVEIALPSAATPQERVELLEARDQALDMLRRPSDRMEGLAELAALSEALGDSHLELDVRLRRAAALRGAEEEDRAAELARDVRELAASRGDRPAELAACMELGQDLLRITAGEGFVPPIREVDLDGAEEAYRRAIALAAELGDDGSRATALREVGVVLGGRIRAWFVDQVAAGGHIPIVKRVAAGEVLEDLLPELPVAPLYHEAAGLFEQALELFERVGDRRGAMSTIIAMGYLSWAPDIHLGSGSARHIEEIRRLTSKMRAFTNESERAAFETQMLYGVHVFARAKVVPDLAVSRGEEAYRHAHETGDRALEFLAAGGTAMAYLDLGEVDRGQAVDRSRGRGGRREPDAAQGAPAGDLARARAGVRRRRRGDARAPGAGGRARNGDGAVGRAMRGAVHPRRGGISIGSRAGRRRPARRRGTSGPGGDGALRRAAGASSVGGEGGGRPGARRARPGTHGGGGRPRRIGDGVVALRDARGPGAGRPAPRRGRLRGDRGARMG